MYKTDPWPTSTVVLRMKLFVYGTLMYGDVQKKLLKKRCMSKGAILYHYKRYQVIKDCLLYTSPSPRD